jgi:hypothetical protein
MITRIFSIVLASSLLFAGCKKEETILERGIAYTGTTLVNLNNYGGYEKVNLELENKWVPFDYEVKVTNTTGNATGDIIVTMQKDANPITEYNTVNGTKFTTIPAEAMKIENYEVKIAKGSKKGTFHFEVNPAFLNLANTYAAGFSIAKVTGPAHVSPNDAETRMVVELGTLNKYDGLYSLRGEFKFHPSYAGPFQAGNTIELITSGANSVNQYCTIWGEFCQPFSVTPGDPFDINRFGGMAVNYTVDPATSLVTISGGPGNTTALASVPNTTYNSRYDAAKKTMYVSWGYRNAAGALRQFIDTLVFIRKR